MAKAKKKKKGTKPIRFKVGRRPGITRKPITISADQEFRERFEQYHNISALLNDAIKIHGPKLMKRLESEGLVKKLFHEVHSQENYGTRDKPHRHISVSMTLENYYMIKQVPRGLKSIFIRICLNQMTADQLLKHPKISGFIRV